MIIILKKNQNKQIKAIQAAGKSSAEKVLLEKKFKIQSKMNKRMKIYKCKLTIKKTNRMKFKRAL